MSQLEQVREAINESIKLALPFTDCYAHLQRAYSLVERLEAACEQQEETVPLSEYKELQRLVTRQGMRLMEYESQQEKPEHVAVPFNVWSPIDDGENWYEHPADTQIIEDILGSDAKVGDEYELTACYSVTAKYRIILDNGDSDFEVECISHAQPPRRDWVGLTEYQREELVSYTDESAFMSTEEVDAYLMGSRDTELKLKDLNT